MYWTRVKIVVIGLLIAGFAGVGATFWSTPQSVAEPPSESASVRGTTRGREKEPPPEDVDKLARDMAQSRLNLRKLALAMHEYAKKNGHLPPPAIYDKKGKALLSWRVALLPYLDQNNLYKLFHLDEAWDSEYNKQLLNILPKVYLPVGQPVQVPLRTYYQVFVSHPPAGEKGTWITPPIHGSIMTPVKMIEAVDVITAAFVKGQGRQYSAAFPDGTGNTLLIVEAGNAVPWTKPEDLHYAADEPLPELGGLFREVFHAVFADGEVHTLTKKYDEKQLRAAITANGGEKLDLAKIEARNRPDDKKAVEAKELRRRNDVLQSRLYDARRHLQLLKEELTVRRERFGGEEDASLQEELKKTQTELDRLNAEIRRWLQPVQKKAP